MILESCEQSNPLASFRTLMIKRRNRPQPRVREPSPETVQPSELEEDEEEDRSLPYVNDQQPARRRALTSSQNR